MTTDGASGTLLSDNKTSRGLQTAVKLLCLITVLAMVGIAAGVYRADMRGLLIFAAFIVFYVQLPGQLILRICGISFDHIPGILACGFFTGWAFVTLQYFVTELIPIDLILYGVGPTCSLIYIVVCLLRRSSPAQRLERAGWLTPSFCIFMALCLLYSMLLTQYLYLSPKVDHIITMNPDKGFHMGLINSLSHGYPLECPWFSGLYYNYHIFTELLYSVPVRLFGLTADTLLFTCGPYMTVYAFGMSLYALFKELCRRKDRAGLYCLAVILSNIFIARGIDQSIAFLFIFRNENVAGYGVSCAMVVIILLRKWYAEHAEKRFGLRAFLPLLAVLMLNTGIKGPFGIVLVAAMWGTFLLGLILRKVHLRTLIPLLILSAGFYVVYAVILGSKGQSASAGESLIALATLLDITFYKAPLIALMKSWGLPSMVRYAGLLAAFVLCLLTAFFLPFVIGYIRELFLVLSGRKEFDFTRVVVYAAVLVGLIAVLILNYHGHSQIYFGFVTVFFAPLIAFWFFEDMEENRGILMKLIRFLFVAALVLSAVGLGSFLFSQTHEAVKASDPAAKGNKYKSISQQEYEAMRWIDKNTPKDSLLATDRYYSVSPKKFDVTDRWDNRFFLYADYSNRICYLAGAGYNLPARDWQKRLDRIKTNDRLFDASDAERGDLARDLGIDYVVLSKRFTDAGDLSNKDYKLCFSNEDIDVYEITD